MRTQQIVGLESVQFAYRDQAPALVIRQLSIARGDRVFLEGASGSGKSTLLGIVAGVLVPQSGQVQVCGQTMNTLTAAARDAVRADYLGYVFQLFNLIPWLSVLDNVLLPVRFSARRRNKIADSGQSPQAAARRLLSHLKLTHQHLNRPVTELSVGQQQRVAVARALIGEPDLIIADEPTSALDAVNRMRFIDLLLTECADHDATILFVSHDPELGNRFDTRLSMAELNLVCADA